MKLVYFDTETTCIPDKTPTLALDVNVIIQLAFIMVDLETGQTAHMNEKFKNETDISIEAMYTTNITPEELEDKPLFKDSKAYSIFKELVVMEDVTFVTHNFNFDAGVMKRAGIDMSNVNYIDTFKIARLSVDRGMKDYESCKLEYIKYYHRLDRRRQKVAEKLKLDVSTIFAHDALSDTIDLFIYVAYLVDEASNEENPIEILRQISMTPLIYTKMPFGKHKDKYLKDMSYNELLWVYENVDNEDLVRSVARYIGK